MLPPIFKDLRLGALSAGNFMIGTSMFITVGLLDQLAADLGVSIATAGYLVAAFALTSVIAAPLFATLSGRFDRRALLSVVLLLCALANGLAYFAQDYPQLLATRVVAAIASAIFTPQAAAILGLLVPARHRIQATSAIMLGWSLAAVIGVPLGVWIGHQVGWRTTYGIISGASLLVAGAVWLALPSGLFVPAINLRSWAQVLRTPALLLLIATSTIFASGHHSVFSYIAPTINSLQPDDPTLLSSLLMTYGIAAVLSNVLAILLMERLGLEHIVRIWGLVPLAVLLAWPIFCGNVTALFVLMFLWALGASGFNGLQQSRLASVAPQLAAASIALNSSAFYLGVSTGSIVGGAAWSWLGPTHLSLLGATLILMAMLISRKSRHAVRKIERQLDSGAPPL